MNTIPTISEEDIRDLVDDASFQRGRAYYQGETLFNTRRQGMTLKARCQGSRPDAYHVEATFDPTHVISTDCSCPIGGYCKHVAALLLTWVHQPEAFLEQPDMDTLLEQYSKAELIKLIKKMLKREPDFEMLLSVPGKQHTPVDTEKYRRQIGKAFRYSYDYEWDDSYGLPDELLEVREAADELIEQQDYTNGIAVYDVLVMEVLEHADQYPDEDGELSSFIAECIGGLDVLLNTIQNDKALREHIMHILFSAYQRDIEIGGVGIAEEVPGILLRQATAEERQTIIGWVHEVLSRKKVEYDGSGWRHEQYGGLLLDLQADTLDDETFLRISRETGRAYDLIARLLQLGRIDEAVRETQQVNDYQLIGIADLFVQHGHDTVAEQIVRERTKNSKNIPMHDTRMLEWLKQRYLARNDLEAALVAAQELFHKYLNLSAYQEIRQLARQLGRWETMRPQLLAILDKPQQTHLVIQIALDEGEIDKALQLVQAEQPQPGYRYGYSYGYSTIALDVAKAAAETRPAAAIRIYQQYTERLIAQRGRGSYQEACKYLVRIRDLYQKLGEHELWTSYITNLRDQNRNLRALKEELASARL